MNPETKNKLQENGFDVEKTLERFMGNEELYLKFLKKFPQDMNYEALKEALREKDSDKAFSCAHTLKGVTANLGVDGVMESIIPLVESFRSGITEVSEAELEVLEEKYITACRIIAEI